MRPLCEIPPDDQSCMLNHTDEGRSKQEVLQDAARVFVDLLYDDTRIRDQRLRPLDIDGLRRCLGEICRGDPRRPRAPGSISVGSINATLEQLGRELSSLKGY